MPQTVVRGGTGGWGSGRMVYVANIKTRVVSRVRRRFARDGVGASGLMRALLVMRMET